MQKPTAEDLKKTYGLSPHPEGGFYRRTYEARGKYKPLPAPFQGERPYSTAIYFLLPQGCKSALHRIASDELWHFYLGGPLSIIQISPDGNCEVITQGSDILNGEKLQHVVPAGYWFGAIPADKTDYSFVGCTVSPGFDFAEFEMGNREALIQEYPQHREWIERLTEK